MAHLLVATTRRPHRGTISFFQEHPLAHFAGVIDCRRICQRRQLRSPALGCYENLDFL
jgi:hypothetical protein